jgi:hypothetical protein
VDAQLGITLRVGEQVLYRNAMHVVGEVLPESVMLNGVYAPGKPVSYAMLYYPVLLNPPYQQKGG